MNRLKQLRKEMKMTQQQLADIFNVQKITIARWEKGENQIKDDNAKELADYFNVSIGYLLGHSDFKSTEAEDKQKMLKYESVKEIVDNILDTGYLISDANIFTVNHILKNLHEANVDYLLSLIKYDEKHAEKILESDFFYFSQKNENILSDLRLAKSILNKQKNTPQSSTKD